MQIYVVKLSHLLLILHSKNPSLEGFLHYDIELSKDLTVFGLQLVHVLS